MTEVPLTPASIKQMKKAIDVNDLEAQFIGNSNKKSSVLIPGSVVIARKGPAFIIGGEDNNFKTKKMELSDEEDDDLVIEFDDKITTEPVVKMPISAKSGYVSYATASSNVNNSSINKIRNQNSNANSYSSSPSKTMTVEELEAQLISGLVIGPKSPVSQLVGAGPPPGLSSSSNTTNVNANSSSISPPGITSISSLTLGLSSYTSTSTTGTSSNINNIMSSTAPLPKNDPNREFMNRFERNLIMKIHTTQLTTETPLMDDFYYQALTKKKATASEGSSHLLYFPLPSVADRQKELQRRERRRKQREREREKEGKDKEKDHKDKENTSTEALESSINVELVLGKVSHSSSRKPRQQLQVPSNFNSEIANVKEKEKDTQTTGLTNLHEQVMMGIEAVYCAILGVEDFYLRQEEIERSNASLKIENKTEELKELVVKANEVFYRELRLSNSNDKEKDCKDYNNPNHVFIHFLTIPKGRASLFRVLKLLDENGKLRFLEILVEHFDFLEVVRPETSLEVIDSFIGQVLSPMVPFVGEAEWEPVLVGLRGLFGKRSFVWIALTKAGMVLLCILLSRLEILKATVSSNPSEVSFVEGTSSGDSTLLDEAAALTEKMFDSLEGHLLEFFTTSNPNYNSSRDFYAWQCLALLAMNVESDRKRAMILELRDKILMVVEGGDEREVKNLNVFLNALGLDASQLS